MQETVPEERRQNRFLAFRQVSKVRVGPHQYTIYYTKDRQWKTKSKNSSYIYKSLLTPT